MMNIETPVMIRWPESDPTVTGAGSGLGGISGTAAENPEDEHMILANEDQTGQALEEDDMPVAGRMGHDINEPGDFILGKVDVVEQMERTEQAMDSGLQGRQDQGGIDDPTGELGGSFAATPGGLEEVDIATDKELDRKHIPTRHTDPPAVEE